MTTQPYNAATGTTARCIEIMRNGPASFDQMARAIGVPRGKVRNAVHGLCRNGRARPAGNVPKAKRKGPPARLYVLADDRPPPKPRPEPRAIQVHQVIKPAGTWERERPSALLRPAGPFDGLGGGR